MTISQLSKVSEVLSGIVAKERENYVSPKIFRSHADPSVIFNKSRLEEIISNPLIPTEILHFVSGGNSIDLQKLRLWRNIQTRKLSFFPFGELIRLMERQDVSLVLEGLDNFDGSIAQLVRAIDRSFDNLLCNGSIFYSKLNNEAYPGHRDSEPVLAIQLLGIKRWTIHGPQGRRMLGNYPLSLAEMGPVIESFDLNSGDILYLPAGIPHSVKTISKESMHLAIDLCCRDVSFDDLCNKALEICNYEPHNFTSADSLVARLSEIVASPTFVEAIRVKSMSQRLQLKKFLEKISPNI